MINPCTGFLLAEEWPLRTRAKGGLRKAGVQKKVQKGSLNVKLSLKKWLEAGLPSGGDGRVALGSVDTQV